ncbi:MAG: adenosine deaminase [Erysipelotrichaceae bacterium]
MNTAKIDLHLHLDGSIDIDWAYQIAKSENNYQFDFDSYYQSMYPPFVNRKESIKKFDLTCAVLQSEQALVESSYRLGKRLAESGMIYAEIRFASQQHCQKGLTQKQAVQAVCQGLKQVEKQYPDIDLKVIDCLMHKGDSALVNDRENRETIEVVKELMAEKVVVGLDLAGYENNCDLRQYEYLFKLAKEYNIPYTIHAGEMGNGENVVTALSFQPDRIGHGVNCVNDNRWFQAAKDSGKVFEVCLSSNCKAYEYITHPVRKMIDGGVKVAVCCDNMMFSRTFMQREHQLLKDMGVSEKTLMQCNYNAVDGAFCDEQIKEKLRYKLKKMEI